MHAFLSFHHKKRDDTRGRELAHTQHRLPCPGNDGLRQEAGLACRVTLVTTEGLRASLRPTLAENPQRIQFLDEVVGMLIVLGKEAEGHGGHRVVTPGPVQAAEEVTTFLGKERTIGVWSRWEHRHGMAPGTQHQPARLASATKTQRDISGPTKSTWHWHEPEPQEMETRWALGPQHDEGALRSAESTTG